MLPSQRKLLDNIVLSGFFKNYNLLSLSPQWTRQSTLVIVKIRMRGLGYNSMVQCLTSLDEAQGRKNKKEKIFARNTGTYLWSLHLGDWDRRIMSLGPAWIHREYMSQKPTNQTHKNRQKMVRIRLERLSGATQENVLNLNHWAAGTQTIACLQWTESEMDSPQALLSTSRSTILQEWRCRETGKRKRSHEEEESWGSWWVAAWHSEHTSSTMSMSVNFRYWGTGQLVKDLLDDAFPPVAS